MNKQRKNNLLKYSVFLLLGILLSLLIFYFQSNPGNTIELIPELQAFLMIYIFVAIIALLGILIYFVAVPNEIKNKLLRTLNTLLLLVLIIISLVGIPFMITGLTLSIRAGSTFRHNEKFYAYYEQNSLEETSMVIGELNSPLTMRVIIREEWPNEEVPYEEINKALARQIVAGLSE